MKKRDILFLLISSVIIVVAWIAFAIIHNSLSSTINETTTAQIIPIPGSFDTQTIASLKKRQQINALFVAQTATVSAAISPTPIPPAPTPTIATGSAVITPNLTPAITATPGGN
jgi:hypothetical protein